jgi:predicted glutamine amidotransferase
MCRILLATAAEPFDPQPLVADFAAMCGECAVYQGHGWGAAWRGDAHEGDAHDRDLWRTHHDLAPIWEAPALPAGPVRHLLVHARSAFRDEGIALENNMPFTAGGEAFVFNGELHGVRLKVPGRIGAERIFNLTRRLGSEQARAVLLDRTERVLGMNWITADAQRAMVSSYGGEDPDYYTLHATGDAAATLICSRPLPSATRWRALAPGILEVPLCTSSRSAAPTT